MTSVNPADLKVYRKNNIVATIGNDSEFQSPLLWPELFRFSNFASVSFFSLLPLPLDVAQTEWYSQVRKEEIKNN